MGKKLTYGLIPATHVRLIKVPTSLNHKYARKKINCFTVFDICLCCKKLTISWFWIKMQKALKVN